MMTNTTAAAEACLPWLDGWLLLLLVVLLQGGGRCVPSSFSSIDRLARSLCVRVIIMVVVIIVSLLAHRSIEAGRRTASSSSSVVNGVATAGQPGGREGAGIDDYEEEEKNMAPSVCLSPPRLLAP